MHWFSFGELIQACTMFTAIMVISNSLRIYAVEKHVRFIEMLSVQKFVKAKIEAMGPDGILHKIFDNTEGEAGDGKSGNNKP